MESTRNISNSIIAHIYIPSVFSCPSIFFTTHKICCIQPAILFVTTTWTFQHSSQYSWHPSSNATIPSTLHISSLSQTRFINAHNHPTLPKAWPVSPSSRKAAAIQGPSTAATALLMGQYPSFTAPFSSGRIFRPSLLHCCQLPTASFSLDSQLHPSRRMSVRFHLPRSHPLSSPPPFPTSSTCTT